MNTLKQQVDDFMKKMKWQYFDTSKIISKIKEETKELEKELKVGDKMNAELEYGDLLFAIFCLANKEKISPEVALKRALQKFEERDKDRYPDGK